MVVHEHGKEEQTINEDFDLMAAQLADVVQAEMAFPSLEDYLDAPAQAIKRGRGGQQQLFLWGVGQEDVPAQEVEVIFAMAQALVAIGARLAAAFCGDLWGQGKSQEAHWELLALAQEQLAIQSSVRAQHLGQIDRGRALGAKEGDPVA